MEGWSGDISITVVYDSSCRREGLETGWGFSAVVRGTANTILFDTGRDASVLANMESLSIDPADIDVVFLSHVHPDHTGGLNAFLKGNPAVVVYLPKIFPKSLKDSVTGFGAEIVEVARPSKICQDVHSTGVLGKWIREQAMVIRTDKGLILLAGCSHPGILRLASRARELLRNEILLVLGGFHLEWATKSRIERTISALKKLGVRHVAACHCSGDKAKALLEKHYGTDCINVGAGDVISAKGLP